MIMNIIDVFVVNHQVPCDIAPCSLWTALHRSSLTSSATFAVPVCSVIVLRISCYKIINLFSAPSVSFTTTPWKTGGPGKGMAEKRTEERLDGRQYTNAISQHEEIGNHGGSRPACTCPRAENACTDLSRCNVWEMCKTWFHEFCIY